MSGINSSASLSISASCRPALNTDDVKLVLAEQFGIREKCVDEIKSLDSYDDQNFYVKLAPCGSEVVLKITNWKCSQNLNFFRDVTQLMLFVSKLVPCSTPRRTRNGDLLGFFKYRENDVTRTCLVRLFEFLPGDVVKPKSLTSMQALQWGDLLGRLHKALQGQAFSSILQRSFLWSWHEVHKIKQLTAVLPSESLRSLVIRVLNRFEDEALPLLKNLGKEILHGDFNERNVLTNSMGEIYAVLDFGDCHGGPHIWDVAVMLAYISLVAPNIEENLVDMLGFALAGYARRMTGVLRIFHYEKHLEQSLKNHFSIVGFIRVMVCARLCQSLILGLHSFKICADPYVLTSQEKGWPALQILWDTPESHLTTSWASVFQICDIVGVF